MHDFFASDITAGNKRVIFGWTHNFFYSSKNNILIIKCFFPYLRIMFAFTLLKFSHYLLNSRIDRVGNSLFAFFKEGLLNVIIDLI